MAGRKKRAATGRPYHHGHLRQALIEAALAEIRRSGSTGLSLRAVAQRAGVSAAAPYRHFQDKEELLAALAEEGFTALARQMEEAGARAGNARERLLILGQAYVSFARSHPEHFRILFGPELADLERHRAAQAAGERAFSLLVDAVERCQEEGSVRRGEPRSLARAAWAMAHGLASLAVAGRLPDAEETVPRSLSLFVAGLGPLDRAGGRGEA